MCIVGSSIYVHCTHTYLVFLEHAGNDVRQIILSLLKKLLNGSSPHCRFHLFSIHISIYVCVWPSYYTTYSKYILTESDLMGKKIILMSMDSSRPKYLQNMF